MNTNKQWSIQEDRRLYDKIWGVRLASMVMDSAQLIERINSKLNTTYIPTRTSGACYARLLIYIKYIKQEDRLWTSVNFHSEFRTWYYQASEKKFGHKKVIITGRSYSSYLGIGGIESCKQCDLYLGCPFDHDKLTNECSNVCVEHKIDVRSYFKLIKENPKIDTFKKEHLKQDAKLPVYVVKDKVYDVIQTDDWKCNLCDLDKNGECIKLPMYCKSSYMLTNYGFKFGYYKLRKEKPIMETPKTISTPQIIDGKATINLNGQGYEFERSSNMRCSECVFSQTNGRDCHCDNKGFSCNIAKLGSAGRWIKSVLIQSNTPKPFTIDDIPENALLTLRTGQVLYKLGNRISNMMGYSAPFTDNKRDIISVQEITFGENLMPKTLRYSVVDTEDNIVHTLESTKELHLVKE